LSGFYITLTDVNPLQTNLYGGIPFSTALTVLGKMGKVKDGMRISGAHVNRGPSQTQLPPPSITAPDAASLTMSYWG
jgi:hypothetical protein